MFLKLTGKYIYADYCSKNFLVLQYDSTNAPIDTLLLTSPFGQPLVFATDKNQETLFFSFRWKNI